jgi:hypothetical protein
MSSDKTITKTYRLDLEDATIFAEEAEKKGLSESALIRRLVSKYVHNDRYFEGTQLTRLHPETLSALLEDLNEEKAVEKGRRVGRIKGRDSLLARGLPLNFDSLKWFLTEGLSDHGGWFTCNYHEMDDDYLFHLRHNLNHNWSYFVKGFIESTIQVLMDREITAEAVDTTITITIPKRYAK